MKKLIFVTVSIALSLNINAQQIKFFKKLQKYTNKIESSFNEIEPQRKEKLNEIAQYIIELKNNNKPVNVIFICTHNSRRSQFGQVWLQTAANWYGIDDVFTYSGGTEATAFNIRAANALKRAGFMVKQVKEIDNINTPYEIAFAKNSTSMMLFSKKYNHDVNPKKDFMALMVCSEADKSCPNVEGADFKTAIPYDDPKYFDNTPSESLKYDERCLQIATEQFYIMHTVKQTLIKQHEQKK